LTVGTLSVKAYADNEQVSAEVEIVNVGKYYTPFQIKLLPGTYILIADWMGQQQIKAAVVEQDKTTEATFMFEKPSMKWVYFFAITSAISTLASIIGLWLALTRKK
jgi:hypothetical protein